MRSINSIFLLLGFLFCSDAGRAQGNSPAGHDIARLLYFSNTNDIASYFQSNKISFVTYPLKRHAEDYYWVAAYPYSGSDTIDLYCFRHHGPDQWRIQMIYFALNPARRNLSLIERESGFIIKDGDQHLLTYSVKKPTK